MIILSATTDRIDIDLAAAHTSSSLPTLVSWRDRTSSTFVAGRTISASNGTTAADISGSPAASTQRVIDFINVYNADTVTHTVTILFNQNGVSIKLWEGALVVGQTLTYVEGYGWSVSNGTLGYTLGVQALTSSPTDAQTIYFGNLPKAPVTTAAISKVYIPKSGTIKRAEIYCYSGTAGTAENWSLYVRINNTTDVLISTLGAATNERIFSNSALSTAVSAGDYFEIKGVNPTWATNPLTTIFGGYIYIE